MPGNEQCPLLCAMGNCSKAECQYRINGSIPSRTLKNINDSLGHISGDILPQGGKHLINLIYISVLFNNTNRCT